jgi:hypothetical protein
MNPISVTAVEASFHEMRDKSYLCSVCGIGNEMSNCYRRPSIVASYHVSVHLAKKFLEENILKKSANQKQESPVVTMFVSGSGRNALSLVLQRTFHRWFLLSCTSFGWSVSEEKIKMWKVSRWQTTDGGCHVMVKASIAFRTLCFNIISHYVSPADSRFFTSISSSSYIRLTRLSTHW